MYKKKRRSSNLNKEEIVGDAVLRMVDMLQRAGISIPPEIVNMSHQGWISSCKVAEQNSPYLSTIPDPLDGLTKATMCSLVDIVSANIYLVQQVCHTVPVEFGYVVTQPTFVWPNAKDVKLPIPIGDEIIALGEALFQQIQWQRGCIEIPPRTRHPPTSGPTSSSCVHPHLHPRKSASPSSSIHKDEDERSGAQQDPPHHSPQSKTPVQEQTPPPQTETLVQEQTPPLLVFGRQAHLGIPHGGRFVGRILSRFGTDGTKNTKL